MKMKKERKESECMRLLWMASKLVEMEEISRLAVMNQSRKLVEKDKIEPMRLFDIVTEGADNKQSDGFDWEKTKR